MGGALGDRLEKSALGLVEWPARRRATPTTASPAPARGGASPHAEQVDAQLNGATRRVQRLTQDAVVEQRSHLCRGHSRRTEGSRRPRRLSEQEGELGVERLAQLPGEGIGEPGLG